MGHAVKGRGLRRPGRSKWGSAAVELVVALPVLILLAIGAADFGRMFSAGIAVANAARAAAEFGAYSVANSTDTSLINQAGRDDAADVAPVTVTSRRFCKCPDGTTPSCTATCSAPYNQPQVFVRADATKAIQLLIRFPGFPQTLTIRDSATFRAQ